MRNVDARMESVELVKGVVKVASILMKVYSSNRKMFIRDAISFELVSRKMKRFEELGRRIEQQRVDRNYIFVNPLLPNDSLPIPLYHLSNSMIHARDWDIKFNHLKKG